MKKLLQIEELALFGACLFFFSDFGLSWWWFVGCILLPDVSTLGYLGNARTGALTYNLFHHRGVAIIIYFTGMFLKSPPMEFVGFILFAHATMDRMLGYGLKHEKGFRFTHLGMIGKDDKGKLV